MLLKHAGAQGGRRRIWTGRQSVTGLTQKGRQAFPDIFTPIGNLESPINPTPLIACGWTVGGSHSSHRDMGEHPHRTPQRKTLARW